MEIPEGAKTYELSSSIIWFEDGILFSNPKPGVPPVLTMEEINEEMKVFRSIAGNKKMCLVAESSPKSPPPPKDQRDFIAEQITSITKAMALVTTSPVSKMIANLFFGLKPPPYP
ncbi:MAG: DUF7793 family protein, partial [Bacteroidia bacterium]